MRVLLVHPPMRHLFSIFTPSFVPDNWGVYPPLGLLYLASSLETHTSHSVEILDCQLDNLTDDQIRQEVARRRPDVVGIQALTYSVVDAARTAQIVKSVDASIPVVWGGRHTDHYPEETIRLPYVDALVQGEAEVSFARLMDAWGQAEEMKKIPGIYFKHNGQVVGTGCPQIIANLDDLPFPARHLVPFRKYRSVVQKRPAMTTMITSRGCPFRCTFCDENLIKYRQMSAGKVLEEMEACLKMGISEFFFMDDTFTVHHKRIQAICDGILERKWDVVWDVRAHINSVNPAILEKMRSAGCDRIQFGVETGDGKMMKMIRKGIDPDRTRTVFSEARKLGYTTYADFMIGLPSEKLEQMETTFQLAVELDPDYCQFSIFAPFPGTDLFELGLEKGLFKSDHWREFSKDPSQSFAPLVWTELYGKDELIRIRDEAYARFYFRPSYILRSLRNSHGAGDVARKGKVALSMASYYAKKLFRPAPARTTPKAAPAA